MRTDARGRYRVHLPPLRQSATRSISPPSVYRGIAYFSAPLRAARVRGDEARDRRVRHHDAARAIHGAGPPLRRRRAATHRRCATSSRSTSSPTTPSSPRSAATRSTPVWSAPLPRGCDGLRRRGRATSPPSSLRARDGSRGARSRRSRPGVKQISFTYALGRSAFPLEITLDRPNALLEVLRRGAGARRCAAPSLRVAGQRRPREGRTFKRFLAQNAPAGERVRIEVPSTAAAAHVDRGHRARRRCRAGDGRRARGRVSPRRGRAARRVRSRATARSRSPRAIAALDARHDAHDASLADADVRRAARGAQGAARGRACRAERAAA